jgi:CBS-domain-containing membrane protein
MSPFDRLHLPVAGIKERIMPSLVTRFIELKAADVMTRNPVTLKGSDSLDSAIATFERHQITGAPVVDEEHRLIGVLSLWDIVRSRDVVGDRWDPTERAFSDESSLDRTPSMTATRTFSVGHPATVVDCMSPTVCGVSPDQLLVEVSRKMCIAHWHRTPVVADDGRLVGIISTMDVLAAFVNMFDEMH